MECKPKFQWKKEIFQRSHSYLINTAEKKKIEVSSKLFSSDIHGYSLRSRHWREAPQYAFQPEYTPGSTYLSQGRKVLLRELLVTGKNGFGCTGKSVGKQIKGLVSKETEVPR